MPRIAVIVPVLGDGEALKQLVSDLRLQSRSPDAVIVVSGRTDESLAAYARSEQLEYLETPAQRGLQLDTGALAADADILWFIHADARIPLHACESIEQAVERGAGGGCLRFVLQGERSVFKTLLERLVRLRITCGGMAYGDQALFCTAAEYRGSGGFPHWPLFEEVPLVRHLRSRKSFRALAVPVFVATRRWERDGWLRCSLRNRWLAVLHTLGVSSETLAADYTAESKPARTAGVSEPQQ